MKVLTGLLGLFGSVSVLSLALKGQEWMLPLDRTHNPGSLAGGSAEAFDPLLVLVGVTNYVSFICAIACAILSILSFGPSRSSRMAIALLVMGGVTLVLWSAVAISVPGNPLVLFLLAPLIAGGVLALFNTGQGDMVGNSGSSGPEVRFK